MISVENKTRHNLQHLTLALTNTNTDISQNFVKTKHIKQTPAETETL